MKRNHVQQPGTQSEPNRTSSGDWLAGGGEMAKLIKEKDWSETALGPTKSWPQSLRAVVSLAQASNSPISLIWGPGHTQVYNDGYWAICGAKHPVAMGQDFRECWAEAFSVIGEAYDTAWSGRSTIPKTMRIFLDRHGFLEETWFTFSFSPITDESGRVAGLFHPVTEMTSQMLAERRARTLRDLASTSRAKSAEEACALSAQTLAESNLDIPFSLFYLVDADAETARLMAHTGLPPETPVSPKQLNLRSESELPWQIREVLRSGVAQQIEDADDRLGQRVVGPYPERPKMAFALPILQPGSTRPAGVLVAGTSARLEMDVQYRGFYDLVAAAVSTALANARAGEQERRRAEALAEIDRAKTAFFSNVSHEFRTPLTLMLGPTEDALQAGKPLVGDDLKTLYRNELRLLKLVNSLLDFSRVEAGRAQASYEETELSTLTADYASAFRSVVERAGLTFSVRCHSLTAPVFVDRGMWEKIVLNLLSNALKFTFEGGIEVELSQNDTQVELRVRDTGVGIAAEQLPRLFERFHRIEGSKARTHEGSGIGLALVQELVRMHGGEVHAESEVGKGTCFTVSLPLGRNHLPPEQIATERAPMQGAKPATNAYIEEALRWLPEDSVSEAVVERLSTPRGDPLVDTSGARILLADDNADMRDYVARLLRQHWTVETVGDGEAALAKLHEGHFDLVLTDVMMPRLDGFGLLAALKADSRTHLLPVVMLSARAGEESRIEGLQAGADDYLVKPFGARELLARVRTHLNLARLRQDEVLARKKAESLTEELKLADQSKDEFLAMLAHELRNPMAAISSALSMLGRVESDPVKTAKHRKTAQRQMGNLVRLVDDLLDVARITRGKMELRKEEVDLAALVQNALTVTRPAIEARGHELSVTVAPGAFRMEADATRLEQVMVNLLTNAAKYTEPGGSIFVRLSSEVVGDASQAVLRVRDTGRGIPKEMLDSVFDMFVQVFPTVDRTTGGLGLGLTLVRRLVEMHGGSVVAQSEGTGKGSEFVVRLPLTRKSSTREDPKVASPVATVPFLRRRILLVEDSEDVRDTLKDFLEDLGHEVTVAKDGLEGATLLLELRPEVALVDVGLPSIDGYEVARRVRATPGGEGLYLVALTGYGGADAKAKAEGAGFDLHLTKPVNLDRLSQLVSHSQYRN